MFGAFTVPACVGDDPPPTSISGSTEDSGTPTTPDGGGGGSDGSTTDSGGPALTCPKDLGDCDGDPSTGCETSLLSPDNCGACKHACGGTAACVQGECGAETLSSTLDHPFGFTLAGQRALWLSPDAVLGCTVANCSTSTAVMVDITPSADTPVPNRLFSPRQIAADGANFYYETCQSSGSDCSPAQCAITGCKLGGSTILKPNSPDRRPMVLFGGPGAVYTFRGNDGLQRFSIPAPSTLTFPSVGIIDYFGDGYVDAQHFVYIDDNGSLANPTGGIYVCPAAGCVGARGPTLVPPPVRLLAFANDVAFTSSGAELATASIIGCAITGCGGAGTVLATNQAYVSDIVADDKDVYWATVGAPTTTTNSAPVGTIMRCPLPSCAGGPQRIAEQLVNPVGVQLDDEYVYWITYGTGTNKNGTIARRRR